MLWIQVKHDSMSKLRSHNTVSVSRRFGSLTFGIPDFIINADRIVLRASEFINQHTCSEHFRNIDVSHLQQMKNIIFLDLDNQHSFFENLGGSLPDKTFVWGFMGMGNDWRVPTHMRNFLQMEEKGMFYLNERSGPTNDSADFALVLTIGHLAEKLPPEITFTIVSADKGFCEVQRLMGNDTRVVKVVNPRSIHKSLLTVLTNSSMPGSRPIWRKHSKYSCKMDTEQPGLAKKARTSSNVESLRKVTGTLLPGSDASQNPESVPGKFKFVPVTFGVLDCTIPASPAKKARTIENNESPRNGTGTLLPGSDSSLNPGSVPSKFKFVPVTFGVPNCPIPAPDVLRPPKPTWKASTEHLQNLQRMRKIIFLDVAKERLFFQKLGVSLPDETFVWGFIGGEDEWNLPTHLSNFQEMNNNGQWFLNKRSGYTKDSAHFSMVLTIGHLAAKLPSRIAFTIVSTNEGFSEIERLMENDKRDVTVVNPMFKSDKVLYTWL